MMESIIRQFAIKGSCISCERYGSGHINETYLLKTDAPELYILQKINNKIFQDVPALMRNISLVTEHLYRKKQDSNRVLHLIPTLDGAAYYEDGSNGFWRVYDFVKNSVSLDRAETVEDFYQSAVAFGEFQSELADFDAKLLTETIPKFHHTPNRCRLLQEAIVADPKGRAAEVADEIAFALARIPEAGLLVDSDLPLRVTHNDTKLNNVMLSEDTHEPLCVIDLDTVMPGYAANDFGDSIRFGASTGAEDEKDLNKIEMSLELYEAYTRGFLKGCGGRLTATEIESLPIGTKLMTYECGIRFLTDYLMGDTYFRIHYPEQNLDRTRTQFKLVADMEQKWDEMYRIVRKIYAETEK